MQAAKAPTPGTTSPLASDANDGRQSPQHGRRRHQRAFHGTEVATAIVEHGDDVRVIRHRGAPMRQGRRRVSQVEHSNNQGQQGEYGDRNPEDPRNALAPQRVGATTKEPSKSAEDDRRTSLTCREFPW